MSFSKGLTLIFKSSIEEDAGASIEEIKKIGLNCCLLPALTYEFIQLKELLLCLKQPDEYSGLILTSPRAVEALSIALTDVEEWDGSLCGKWLEKPIFVVGPKTATLTESKLHLSTVGKESGNAESLSLEIIQKIPSGEKPLLFPCGNLKREVLPTTLKQNGINLQTINVYISEPHPKLHQNIKYIIDKQGIPEYILYYSPSGVKFTLPYFLHLQVPLDECKLVAIGPATQSAIEAEGLKVHCTALQPTDSSIAKAICNAL